MQNTILSAYWITSLEGTFLLLIAKESSLCSLILESSTCIALVVRFKIISASMTQTFQPMEDQVDINGGCGFSHTSGSSV